MHVAREGSTTYCTVLVLLALNSNIGSESFLRDQGVRGENHSVVDACPDSIPSPS